MKTFLLSTLVIFGLSIGVLAKTASPNVLDSTAGIIETQNPGFEGDYAPVNSTSDAPNAKAVIRGSVASGWADNSNWADVDIEYSRDTDNPHRGEAAQKIAVNRVMSGAVQFVQTVPLHRGRIHLWKLWMRGRPGNSVTLSIRQAGAPYTPYAEQTANLSAEWQEFRIFGVIPEETAGFLMVRTTSPMTFWLDDSTLQNLTSASTDSPPLSGNLLAGGGSFEAGMPYGWSVRYQGDQGFQAADPRPKIDATSAAVGKQSLRCDMPVGSGLRIGSPLLNFNYGRAHTISFWAKATVPDTPLEVHLEKALDGSVTLGTQWKRHTITGKLPFLPYTQLRFQVPQTSTGNTVWIDGVQVEEKAEASPDYVSSDPVDLSLDLPQPGHILLERENGRVNFKAVGPIPTGARLQLSAVDLNEQTIALPGVALPAESFLLPAMNNRYGTWKLKAQVVDSGGKALSAPYELVWARLPKPKNIDAEKSYFGLHLPLDQNHFDIARRIGVRRTRLHDTSMVGKWNTVEPQKDTFNYYDAGIDMAKRSGIEVLGMLDGAPAWTTTQPREGYWGFWNIPDQPGASDRWDNYVRHVVGHYKGRIDSWEIWNEPWGTWWTASGNPHATPQLYGELSRRAYTNAKAVNPNVSILGIDTYPGSRWTGSVLPYVTPKFYDGMSFHEYNDALFGGPRPIPALRKEEFQTAQAKVGLPKPLWNTEGGLFSVGSWLAPETGGTAAAQQPSYIVRYDVTQMAAGIRASYLYAMHTDPMLGDTQTATAEYDRSVKPILTARAVLASKVDGLGTPTRTEPVKGVERYTYPGEKVSVAWSYDGETHSMALPRGAKALDIWGNALIPSLNVSVTNEPIYLVR